MSIWILSVFVAMVLGEDFGATMLCWRKEIFSCVELNLGE